MSARVPWLVVTALLGAAAAACGEPDAPDATPPAAAMSPAERPTVDLAGCDAIEVRARAAPVCRVGSGPLTVWVAANADGVVLSLDGHPVEPDRASAGGTGFTVAATPAARALVLTTADGGAPVWRHALAPTLARPWLRQALAQRSAGDLAAAAATLDAHAPTLAREDRGLMLGMRARLALSRGAHDAAIAQLRQAIDANTAAGYVRAATHDGLALAYTLAKSKRDLSGARAVLEGLDGVLTHYDEGRARVAYHRALVAKDAGDLRTALGLLDEAAARAERLAMTRQWRNARQVGAHLLRRLGRRDDAAERLGQLLATTEAPCERAALHNNLGWLGVRADASLPELDAARHQLVLALGLRRGACADPSEEANALTNLAWAAHYRGDHAATAARLAEARSADAGANAFVAESQADLRGRLALAAGDHATALTRYEALLREDDAQLSLPARWRALVGLGRAQLAAGRVADAIGSLQEAEALLDRRLALVPITVGHDGFLDGLHASARALVGLLADRGDAAAALRAARRARARAIALASWPTRVAALDDGARQDWERTLSAYREGLATLEALDTDDWALPEDAREARLAARAHQRRRLDALMDQGHAVLGTRASGDEHLAEPGPGEVVLMYHPVDQGWIGFAATVDGVALSRLALPAADAPPEAVAAALLVPFRDVLRQAQRITVLPVGEVRAIDIHALPFDGAPLAARAPVAYALDLPLDATTRARPTSGTVLLIADPRDDLPAARREVEAITVSVGGADGWRSQVLTGPQATGPAVRDAIPGAALLHYAGHGEFRAEQGGPSANDDDGEGSKPSQGVGLAELGGASGWSSALLLAGGDRLTVSDILALSASPPQVILSGCETGRAGDAAAEGLGLAHAFIARGARAVVAATRPVDDAVARRLGSALYRHFDDAGLADLPQALRAAQRALASVTPTADWAAFRALVARPGGPRIPHDDGSDTPLEDPK